MPSIERPGLSVLGINSAYGHTIKGGYCPPGTARSVEEYFAAQPKNSLKVLAVHHPLVSIQGLDGARGGRMVLDAAFAAGVDMICCGHGHVARVEACGNGVILVSLAGTAASNRWRAPQEEINSWHLIDAGRDGLQISARCYDVDAERFAWSHAYPSIQRQSVPGPAGWSLQE